MFFVVLVFRLPCSCFGCLVNVLPCLSCSRGFLVCSCFCFDVAMSCSRTCEYLVRTHMERNDKVILFGDNVFSLRQVPYTVQYQHVNPTPHCTTNEHSASDISAAFGVFASCTQLCKSLIIHLSALSIFLFKSWHSSSAIFSNVGVCMRAVHVCVHRNRYL